MTDWNKLKVPDLKAELKNRSLSQTGLKADLVARLHAADNESGFESETTVQDDLAESLVYSETLKNPESEPEIINELPTAVAVAVAFATPHLDAPVQNLKDTASTSISTPAVEEATSDSKTVDHLQSDSDDSPFATVEATAKSGVPPTELQEVKEDIQKRKRRSQSPPPLAEDTPRKRARHDKDLPPIIFDNGPKTVVADFSDQIHEHVSGNNSKSDGLMQGVSSVEAETWRDRSYVNTSRVAEEDHVGGSVEPLMSKKKKSVFNDLFSAQSSKIVEDKSHENSSLNHESANIINSEPDRYVIPSIHPATSALYIRNFMRPLKQNALRDYLATLATPPGASPDPNIIIDFFVDPMKTHSFVSFTSISAASRVRSELHDRIWPDERPRKALWADFIPPERIQGWIDAEQSSGSSRSAAKKWQIVYDFDEGTTILSLQEVDMTPASARNASFAPVPIQALPPPRVVIPTDPGVQGAPAGPRAEFIPGPRASTSLSNLDQLFKSTGTKPVLYFQPVSPDLAAKRLGNMDKASSKHYSKGNPGSEINRYTFEDRHNLVDRGPERFSGIRRPPGYRGRGGGSGYRGSRGGRGGGRGDRYEGRRREDWDQRDRGRDRRF